MCSLELGFIGSCDIWMIQEVHDLFQIAQGQQLSDAEMKDRTWEENRNF